MDYERIYSAFIADRRGREADLAGYSEKHHIKPRALGGTDEPVNLIRLSAEDHFFAHLLLAKIYGGKLWAPIAFMVGGDRKSWTVRRSRREYGWARRSLALALSGEGHHAFDREVRHLRHKDGRTWAGLQSEMIGLGLSKSMANMLIKGRVNSAEGWFLAEREEPRRDGEHHPAYRAESFSWLHTDGRRFTGTAFDLAVEFGLNRMKTANVRAGRQRSYAGWYIDGRPPSTVGRGAKGAVPVGERGVVAVALAHQDGRAFVGSRRQAAESLGLSRGNLNMVINGQRAHTKGWSLAA